MTQTVFSNVCCEYSYVIRGNEIIVFYEIRLDVLL